MPVPLPRIRTRDLTILSPLSLSLRHRYHIIYYFLWSVFSRVLVIVHFCTTVKGFCRSVGIGIPTIDKLSAKMYWNRILKSHRLVSFGDNLTLRKIAIWMSKNCQKRDFFPPKLYFFPIFDIKIFFTFLQFFFDIQMTNSRRVKWAMSLIFGY